VVETAVYEVLAVARAAGIHPPGLEDPKVALAGALKIATQMAEALSSTGQDMKSGQAHRDRFAEWLRLPPGGGTRRSHACESRLVRLVKLAEGRS